MGTETQLLLRLFAGAVEVNIIRVDPAITHIEIEEIDIEDEPGCELH